MSGVYIKGMEMPKSCDVCDFVFQIDEGALGTHNYCVFPGNGVYVDDCIATRHKSCPLIPVPDHGRLIDKDALEKDISESVVFSGRERNAELIGAKKIINRLHRTPTIIPASGGKENEF